jgi:hypothetical protein
MSCRNNIPHLSFHGTITECLPSFGLHFTLLISFWSYDAKMAHSALKGKLIAVIGDEVSGV